MTKIRLTLISAGVALLVLILTIVSGGLSAAVASLSGPQIASSATPISSLRSRISDTATLSDVTAGATGTITFAAYSDPWCTRQVFKSRAIAINGAGTYPSARSQAASFVPSEIGTYYWIAAYSGDSLNSGASGSCGESSEISVVPDSNWAGAVVENPSNADVRGAFGSWVVPAVTSCPRVQTLASSTWVGIGGDIRHNGLYQTGTSSDCVNGKPQYGAWQEAVLSGPGISTGSGLTSSAPCLSFQLSACNRNEKPLANAPVGPGDQMTAAAVDHGLYTRWTLSDNSASGHSWSLNGVWLSDFVHRNTAECIQEATTINGRVSFLPDFGQVTFSNCQASDTSGTLWDMTGSSFPSGWHSDLLEIGNGSKLLTQSTVEPLTVTWLASV